ncbi:hypothetical protein E5288_WYG005847 [Bos mutus]|uniref:Uncharacterized protein n=1 Tax=Bos mutus TaxID=72004 RepID=A0A6B0QUH5_9CETA|nr:hypothetical protein [Bos mutus]
MALPLITELRLLGPLSGRSQVPGRRSQGYPGAREQEARRPPTSGGVALPSRERHSDLVLRSASQSPRAPMGAPAPVFCLLLACVWLPRGEPAGEFPPLQSLGERGVD